jgi:hypothetical protein
MQSHYVYTPPPPPVAAPESSGEMDFEIAMIVVLAIIVAVVVYRAYCSYYHPKKSGVAVAASSAAAKKMAATCPRPVIGAARAQCSIMDGAAKAKCNVAIDSCAPLCTLAGLQHAKTPEAQTRIVANAMPYAAPCMKAIAAVPPTDVAELVRKDAKLSGVTDRQLQKYRNEMKAFRKVVPKSMVTDMADSAAQLVPWSYDVARRV